MRSGSQNVVKTWKFEDFPFGEEALETLNGIVPRDNWYALDRTDEGVFVHLMESEQEKAENLAEHMDESMEL